MDIQSSKEYTYYPMHMHLHAACDHGASMASHMYNAQRLGMRYIWFTDHDTRTGIKKHPVNGFSFDAPSLIKKDPGGFSGFQPVNDAITYTVDSQNKQLQLALQAPDRPDWYSSGIFFLSSGTRHTCPLAANVTLQIDLKDYPHSTDTRLIFSVTLSQRPPELKKAHLLYVLGNTDGLDAPHTQIIPLQPRFDKISLPVSQDVSEDPSIGGKDNVFDTLSVLLQARNGVEATATLGDFRIHIEKSYEQVHLALKETAKKAGKNFGVTPFVAFEVSGAGEHKNCYSTAVPTIDYQKHGHKVPVWEAVRHIKNHNGIFAINHPFAISDLKRKTFSPVERMQILAKMLAELTANRAYGAHLIEVGFPEGRNGFSLAEYLLLWDMLSAAGLFLSGYGCSDSHRDNTGWFEGNNFAAYIGVSSGLSHPIAEEAFVEAMKTGRMYTGDPVILQGAVRFQTADGHPMGSVFLSRNTDTVPLVFSAEKTRPGWQFRLIENGHLLHSQEITGESFTWRSDLKLGKTTVNFQRAEFYDETGRCILLTNPIYLINTELYAGELPSHRIPKEATQ